MKTITLKTLPYSTAQEVFEFVATNLLKQNCKSVDEFGKCKYRGINGMKCAAGFLISDEEYKEEFDNFISTFSEKTVGMNYTTIVNKGFAPKANYTLISELQCIHDFFDPKMWREKLKQLSSKFKLDMNFLENINTENSDSN